jgi:N-hydroxyarylamine O-acetyltransferase
VVDPFAAGLQAQMERQTEVPGRLLDERVVERYLGALKVTKRAPALDAFAELVEAQITRVPFENISKLYYRKHLGLMGPPPVELFLDGMEKYSFGGTCYSNNFHFYTLLQSLGYEVRLCSADMSTPDVHMVIMAAVDGRHYLVDTGYAAPFLLPLSRDLAQDYEITLGRDRYLLEPQDALGCSRLAMYRDGVLKHGYLAKPAAKKLQDFQHVIAHSFRPDATFLNAVLLARFYRNRSVVIHNLSLIESQGAESAIHALGSRDELVAQVEQHFGIPRSIVADAVTDLRNLADAWV